MPLAAVHRDPVTETFFDFTARSTFPVLRCRACGKHSGPKEQQCWACACTDLEPRAAAGGARLVSWSVTHTRPQTGEEPARTVLAVAELDEGPWWWSQLLDADPAALAVGQRLRIDFERPEGGEAVPVFRPALTDPARHTS
ncbi:Zn-ribbon domain-containing OB-fold protein [Streptomyces sp. GbtcB7]|uniref:Zn-ribbon domain-containing OB-fold protein n=1 Tax=Streptomyces sp. GbtcB7 TaxID=2824752 RepID=UPI001C2F48A3|nr:OB-fold domain-containing protein [Streptomyces sp. GbtcB7]